MRRIPTYPALLLLAVVACSNDPAPTGPRPLAPRRDQVPSGPVVDGFEGPGIDPSWTVTQTLGSVSLTSAVAHSGSQALAFVSSGGGQKDLHLHRQLSSPTAGTYSIYFYDTAPGTGTLYELVILQSSTQPNILAQIGIMDYDAYCYVAQVNVAYGSTVGPNANCGNFPQVSTTNVARTAGWHRFDVLSDGASIKLSIDGQQVFATSGDYRFDIVDIAVTGPGANTTAYYDDFSFTPLAGTGPTFAFDGFFQPVDNMPTVNLTKAGSAIPVKFSLGADYGLSIFAPGYPATASVSCNSSSPTSEIEQTVTAGASSLTYSPETNTYFYVWKTDKEWAGTCRQFIAKLTDGTEHRALFRFR